MFYQKKKLRRMIFTLLYPQRDGIAHHFCRLALWVIIKVRVTLRGADLCMSEHLADQGQGRAAGDEDAGEGMA